jgi:hypothetical protein
MVLTTDGVKKGRKQRDKGPEQWNRITEKGTMGQCRVRLQRKEDGKQGTET